MLQGLSALWYAATSGHVEVAGCLVSAGGDVNAKNGFAVR